MYLSALQKRLLALLQKEEVLTTQIVAQKLRIPQITASRNLKKLSQAGYFMALGKARATHYVTKTGTSLAELEALKNELDAYRPFPPEILKNIESALNGKFVHATNKIEGARLTLRETDLILAGVSVKGNRQEIQDVKNQKQALDLIRTWLKTKKGISEEMIKNLQKQVTAGVKDVFLNGKYRDHDVAIAGTNKIFPPAREISSLMQTLVAKINLMAEKKQHPAIMAAYAHYQITAIHPFFDGNGRTARLLMNALLLKHHYPIAIIEFSQRENYYAALQKADKGFYEIFQSFIFESIKNSLEFYLRILRQ